jgi:hypothetical protein
VLANFFYARGSWVDASGDPLECSF